MSNDAVSHQRPMSGIHTRKKLLRRSVLSTAVLVALCVSTAWYRHSVQTAAEEDALEFVGMNNGFLANGYRHNLVSALLAFIPRRSDQYPIGVKHTFTVGFPRDRMSNNMAKRLVNIRHLDGIVLYPPDPDDSGIDSGATAVSKVQSLRDLELPLSENSISLIEERFPNLVIYVAERPGSSATPDALN